MKYFLQICISSIFPEVEDINVSIFHAADSIGLKEIPRYEVKIYEEDDWMKRSQVNLFFSLFCFFIVVSIFMLLIKFNACANSSKDEIYIYYS